LGLRGSGNPLVVEDEPWLSIRLDRKRSYVHAEWNGFTNSVEFRAGNMKVLQAIRDTHAASLVIDNRRLEGVVPQDQLWIRDTWAPLAVAAGLKWLALVLAPQGLAKIASEDILSQKPGKALVVTRTFDTVSGAVQWVVGEKHSAGSVPMGQ
jgi:hypothetical protein